MLDITFEAAFKRLFVYNILFEDSEVDGRYLRLTPDSRVLGIAAAGCGLASMVRFAPAHIDAVDINSHHLALAALKMKAARDLREHDLLYDLFGHGHVKDTVQAVLPLLHGLPDWIQKYWTKNHNRFEKPLHHQGLTAWMLGGLREYIGLGSAWMRDFVTRSPEERARAIVALSEPVMRQPILQGCSIRRFTIWRSESISLSVRGCWNRTRATWSPSFCVT